MAAPHCPLPSPWQALICLRFLCCSFLPKGNPTPAVTLCLVSFTEHHGLKAHPVITGPHVLPPHCPVRSRCMDAFQFSYPLTGPCVSGLFPLFGYCKLSCCPEEPTLVFWWDVFPTPLRRCPGRECRGVLGSAGSHSSPTLSFLRNCWTVYQGGQPWCTMSICFLPLIDIPAMLCQGFEELFPHS